MAAFLRSLIRSFSFIIFLISFFTITIPVKLMPFALSNKRQTLSYIGHLYCRLMMWMMNVKINLVLDNSLQYQTNEQSPPGKLLVSNHLSYLDVLIYLSLRPTLFVTSLEVKRTPFLGWLTDLGACLYVDRQSRENLSKEVSDITEALKSGFNVMIFPEATSTNAEEVLRFRRPLFQSAIDAKTEIGCFTLNYTEVSGATFSLSNRDIVCWYGDMPFASHLLKLFSQTILKLEITQQAFVKTEQMDAAALAAKTQEIVSSQFRSVRNTKTAESEIKNLSPQTSP